MSENTFPNVSWSLNVISSAAFNFELCPYNKDNARLFGRGLANSAIADENLLPPNEAAAVEGHLYKTCSVVGRDQLALAPFCL
jgi:hypothetical protein